MRSAHRTNRRHAKARERYRFETGSYPNRAQFVFAAPNSVDWANDLSQSLRSPESVLPDYRNKNRVRIRVRSVSLQPELSHWAKERGSYAPCHREKVFPDRKYRAMRSVRRDCPKMYRRARQRLPVEGRAPRLSS